MEYMQITDKLNKLIKGINVEVLLEHVPNPEHKQKGKLWLRPDGKAEFFPAVYIYRFLLPTGNGGVTFISEDYVFWARSFSATTYGYITSELFCYPKSSKKVQYANLKYKNVAFLLGIKDLYGIYHSDFKSIFSDKRMFFCDGISFEAFSASKRNKFTVHVKTESLDLEVKPWMLCGDAFSCLYVETMPEDVLGMRLTMKEVMNGSISDPELSYIPLYLTQITVSEPLEIQYCLTVANNFVLGLALLRGSATKYALRPMVLFNKEEDGFYIDSTFKCSYSFQDMFFYVRDLYSAQGRLYASTILKELCSSNFIKNLFTCLETNEDLSDLADVLSHQPVLPSKNAVLLFSCFEKIFKHLPDALKRSKALYDFFAKKAEQERDTHFEQNYEGEANIFKSYAKSFQTLKSKIKDGEKLNRFTGSKVDQYDEKRQTNFPDRLKLAIPFIVSDTNGTYYSLISYQDLKIMNLRNDLVHANTSPDKSLSQQFVFTDDKNGLFVATEKAQMFIELYMKSLGAMLLLHMCGYQGPVCRMERMFEICKDRSGHEEEGEPYPDIQKLKDRSIYSPYVYIDGCKDCGVSTSTLAREEEL